VLGISLRNILFYKLQRMVARLKQLSKRLFANARIEFHMANDIIHRLGMSQDGKELSPDEIQLSRDLKSRVMGIAVVARRRQASCLCWVDLNTGRRLETAPLRSP
jgi:hypothetical protein